MGVNAQAACDAFSRFISVSVKNAGSTNDGIAYLNWSRRGHLERLPLGYYGVGDNAYLNNTCLLTPYTRNQVQDSSYDAYNFYVSQLRIRIEMAFGLLVNKFQIFKRPLHVHLKNVPRVVLCCLLLHNFCIDERLPAHIDELLAIACVIFLFLQIPRLFLMTARASTSFATI